MLETKRSTWSKTNFLCYELVLGFLFLYYSSFFGPPGQHTSLEYDSRFSRSISWSSDDSGEAGRSDESIFELEDIVDSLVPKSFHVSFFCS